MGTQTIWFCLLAQLLPPQLHLAVKQFSLFDWKPNVKRIRESLGTKRKAPKFRYELRNLISWWSVQAPHMSCCTLGVNSHLALWNRSSVTVANDVLRYDEVELTLGLREIHFQSTDVFWELASAWASTGLGRPGLSGRIPACKFCCLLSEEDWRNAAV